MINATFSTLKTVTHTVESKQIASKEPPKPIINRYEIVEEKILSHNFNDLNSIRQKVIELCNTYEPQPIILVSLIGLPNGSFIIDEKYKYNDSNAIFECIVSKKENNERGKELFRIFGKRLTSSHLSSYRKQHKLIQQVDIVTNITYDEPFQAFGAIFNTRQLESDLIKLDRIIEKDSNDINAITQKGWILTELERYYEAISCFNQVLEIIPEHTIATNLKKQALKTQQDLS